MKPSEWIILLLYLGQLTMPLQAEEIKWRPVQEPAVAHAAEPIPASPAAGVSLSRPIPLQPTVWTSTQCGASMSKKEPTAAEDTPEPNSSDHVAPIRNTSYVIRAQSPSGVPPVPPPQFPGAGGAVLGEENYNCGDVLATPPSGPAGFFGGFYNNIVNPCAGRKFLQSDHTFDTFISPVTNPFIFEDPRALTEFRPIFIYRQAPSGTPIFRGGDSFFFGAQGRLALTERFSIVLHKLGGVWMNVNDPAPGFDSGSGFGELDIGAKFTFLRHCFKGTYFGDSVLAGGLSFEIPVGSSDVFQDTGVLSLRPYISYAQQLLDTHYGRFQFVGTTGLSFAVDEERSDHYFLSAHFDFDVGHLQKIYPFLEFNYFHYTANGDRLDIPFEGRALYNFGARQVSGNNDLSMALGARYKFTEAVQLGGAFELTLLGRKDLMDFGFVFDMIFRY